MLRRVIIDRLIKNFMSYTAEQIALLAGGIYTGIGSPTSQSVGYVSGWLTDPTNLGDLNNRLNTSFFISGGGVDGGFGDLEASIYSAMYKMEYYESQSRNALLGGGSSFAWLNMKEGDSSITRVNPVDISKALLSLHENAQASLYVAISNWKRGQSLVANVDSASSYSWPTP